MKSSARLSCSTLVVLGMCGTSLRSNAQNTVFSENLGTPTGTTSIATYATGTAPATFQNKGTLTYSNGGITGSADIRVTNTSNIPGSSGAGNVFFTSTAGDYGFSIESINASGFNTLQLSYIYRKESATALATFAVDYWNGAAWVTVANAPADLFAETATAGLGWYAAKTLAIPAGAQIAGLKLRFVKSGTVSIRIDDIKLLGTANAGTDTTPPLVSALVPANGSSGFPVSNDITATFNEPVQLGTGTIQLQKTSDGSVIPAAISVAGSTLTINPTTDLGFVTNYTVVIPPGSIKDLSNNPFAGIPESGSWTFTTAPQDVTPPTLVSTVPVNGAVNIAPPATLTATYSEALQTPLFDAQIRVKDSTNTTVATFTSTQFGGDGIAINGSSVTLTIPPATPLGYGKTYYVEFDAGAFEDQAGNPTAAFTGDTTWKFSTVNVPDLTTTPYTQTFATYNSAATLPSGWSFTGPNGFTSAYVGDFGTVTVDPANPAATLSGFKGNASVFGYAHSSSTGTSGAPLVQTLTLRNGTGAPITALSVSYKGREAIPENTRLPAYTVTVGGVATPALAYSTGDGDNAQRNASVSGLSIPVGATFQVSWSSLYPTGAGSARQIGISDVVVSAGVSTFAPTVASLAVPAATVGSLSAIAQANVTGDGGQTLTARGFVFAVTSVNGTPAIGGSGVTNVVVPAPALGSYSATLSGLSPATNYAVRAYATNATGTSYTNVATFTTVGTSPTLVSTYTQDFVNYNGTNPAGWTAISDASPAIQNFVGAWGTGLSTGGFLGLVSDPGVLGYRHTGSTGNLIVTLRLINGTGAVLTSLNVSYKGRVNDITQGRSPQWAVSVAGSDPVVALAYDTSLQVDSVKTATVSGLSIPAGAEFSISWKSDRGAGTGSSKQIGLTGVSISTGIAPGGYSSYASANAGGQGPTLDFDNDGVKNGVEYFFGATGSSFTPNPALVGNTVSYPYNSAATGVTGTIQTSPDLVNWTNVTADTSTPGFLKYTLPASTPGAPKLFVRLNVVVAP